MKKLFAVIAAVMILGLVFGATQVYASSGSASGLEQPILKKTPPGLEKNPGVDKKATQQTEKDLRTAERQLEKGNQNGKKLTFRGTVVSVDLTAKTFVLKVGGTDMTFMTDENTQIKIPTLGKNTTLDELHVGVQASVRALEIVAPEAEVAPEAAPAAEVAPAATHLALTVQVIPGKPVKIHRVGVVVFYEAGVSITIQAKDMELFTFLLDQNTKILPADRVDQLVPGVWVTIISRRDVTGGPLSAQGIVIHPKVEENFTPPTDITLAPTPALVTENAPVGTTVGTFTAVSSKVGATFTFSLVAGTGGTDNASFVIEGNVLKTAASFDFETTPTLSIRVRVTDQDGLFFEKVFTIDVTNVTPELAPTAITLTPLTLANASPAGTVVGVFTTTDPDLGDKTFVYTLVTGTGSTDNASFTINGDKLLTNFVANAVTKNTYLIRVRSTDTSLLFFEQEFTITVNP